MIVCFLFIGIAAASQAALILFPVVLTPHQHDDATVQDMADVGELKNRLAMP
jgi:hypothetical protein